MCFIMSWYRKPWFWLGCTNCTNTLLYALSDAHSYDDFLFSGHGSSSCRISGRRDLCWSLFPVCTRVWIPCRWHSADVSTSYMWTVKSVSHVVTDAWSLFLSWIKWLLTSWTKLFLVCSSMCLCLCQTGVAAWLGGGASYQLWRLPGQRHRPRCSQTDPPVQGHLIWTGPVWSLISVEIILANLYSELNWSEVSLLNPNPVN